MMRIRDCLWFSVALVNLTSLDQNSMMVSKIWYLKHLKVRCPQIPLLIAYVWAFYWLVTILYTLENWLLQFKAIAKFVQKWQHIWIVLWRTDVSSLRRFHISSLLIYRFSYFIIIIIGICFEIMSANCAYMGKWTWFYLSF